MCQLRASYESVRHLSFQIAYLSTRARHTHDAWSIGRSVYTYDTGLDPVTEAGFEALARERPCSGFTGTCPLLSPVKASERV